MTRADYPFPFTSNTFYILAFLPAVTCAGLIYAGTQLTPAGLYFGLAPIPAILAVLFVLVARATNNMSLRIDDNGLEVHAGLRPTKIPNASIKAQDARAVDLEATPELAPVRRTNGSEFAGLRQGWFRLANGEKALLVLTDPRKAVYIPTTEGYSLLVSPPDAAGFLDNIKASSRQAAAR